MFSAIFMVNITKTTELSHILQKLLYKLNPLKICIFSVANLRNLIQNEVIVS